MNELTQFLVDSILKEDEDNLGTVALFGGGFKPPTKGHLEVVLQGLRENPEVKQVYILVGSGSRNGVTQAEAVKIWEMYQKFIPVTSQIIPVQSPFSFFKTYLTDHKDEKVYIFIGARKDNEEDDKDVAERSAYAKKYSENAVPVRVETSSGVSGTKARKAALSGNNEEFISYFPDQLTDEEKQQIIDMISSVVNEKLTIGGKVVKTIHKNDSNNPEDHTIEFEDGTTEPYLQHLNEGRYDSISRQLASIALNAWKSDFKDGASYGYFVGKVTPEEYPTDLTFTFKALGRFVDGEYTHNGYSKSDGEVGVKYEIPKDAIPQIWEEVYMDLISTIRHEIEHQTQGGKNVKPGKGMASDQKLRQLIRKGGDDIVRYVTLPKEIESNVHGLYLKAKKWKRPYEEVVDEYIRYFLKINNPSDVSYVKNKWQEIASKRNLPSLLNENASYSSDIDYKSLIKELTKYMIKDGWNIQPLPKVVFKHGDTENARDFFGKTAYYDPNTKTIVLYTEGRHPKDIVRSFSHEMVHHEQNLEGRLGDIYTTNTQEDDRLNDIEKEANLNGTMTFRNWTDSLNEIGDASAGAFPYNKNRIDTIVNTLKDKIENQPDAKWRQHLLPFLKFSSPNADYEVITTAQVDKPLNIPDFQTRPNLIDLRVDFMVGESDEATNIGEQYKVMATMTQIIKELIDKISKLEGSKLHSVRIFPKSDDGSEEADVNSKRGKLYQAYVKKNLPSGWDMSTGKDARGGSIVLYPPLEEGFDKKLGKDPFGLNQFARELMTEGAYDALTTKLTKATINKWVEDSKKKPMPKKSFVDIDIDEFDGKGREIEFNYVGIVEFDKKIDGYEVDGTSNSGEDKGKMPFVATMFRINPKILPQAWSKISADVSDVIRHEIEHLTQAGDNTRSGKYMEDDIDIRDMINKLKILPKKNYYMLEKEVDAMLQGLYLKAKKSKKPFADVVNNYLDMAPGIETPEDKEMILNLWRSRRKALSLPVFETETGEMPTETSKLFKIFLDMDGVIVDFDKRFEEQFGMPPREFEDNFGSDKFWEKIDSKGVGFWRGMDWMPGGQQLYNRVAKHDHALLSSPSRSELSKIGKRMWRKDNTPNTKLILARSYNKKNYADKSNILIDDRADNIQQWKDAGGIGILYQSAEQVMKELDKLGL